MLNCSVAWRPPLEDVNIFSLIARRFCSEHRPAEDEPSHAQVLSFRNSYPPACPVLQRPLWYVSGFCSACTRLAGHLSLHSCSLGGVRIWRAIQLQINPATKETNYPLRRMCDQAEVSPRLHNRWRETVAGRSCSFR
jgi:hypothetical protein